MEDKKTPPITVGPQDKQSISIAGGTYRILVTGEETRGAFATIEMTVPPNAGPGPHSHADFHETFYVLEGEVEVKSEAGAYTAQKGAYVVIPKGGVVHKFKNRSDVPAKLLCTVMPSGLEEMFIAMGKLPPPTMDEEGIKKMTALAAQYGQTLYPPDFLG